MLEKSIVNCDSCLANEVSCPYKLDIGCIGCVLTYIESQPDPDMEACFREINK